MGKKNKGNGNGKGDKINGEERKVTNIGLATMTQVQQNAREFGKRQDEVLKRAEKSQDVGSACLQQATEYWGQMKPILDKAEQGVRDVRFEALRFKRILNDMATDDLYTTKIIRPSRQPNAELGDLETVDVIDMERYEIELKAWNDLMTFKMNAEMYAVKKDQEAKQATKDKLKVVEGGKENA